MAGHTLIRWVLIVGAVVLVIHQISHPLGETAAFTREATWVPSHVLGYLAFLLLMFGLIGLYARQAEAAGPLGLVAFALTMVGLVIAAGGQLAAEQRAEVFGVCAGRSSVPKRITSICRASL
jgi:hypothetical protein